MDMSPSPPPPNKAILQAALGSGGHLASKQHFSVVTRQGEPCTVLPVNFSQIITQQLSGPLAFILLALTQNIIYSDYTEFGTKCTTLSHSTVWRNAVHAASPHQFGAFTSTRVQSCSVVSLAGHFCTTV